MTLPSFGAAAGTLRSVLPAHCFKNDTGARRLWRTFWRFLNCVEPGPELVLSPTRVGMWAVLILVCYLALHNPGNLKITIEALMVAAPFVVNYMHQRHTDAKTGSNPNVVAH